MTMPAEEPGRAFGDEAAAAPGEVLTSGDAHQPDVPKGSGELTDPAGALRRFSRDLFEDWLPFMDAHVIEPRHGGFPCSVQPDGRRQSDERHTWYEARGAWVYSHLHTTLAPQRRYLDIASRALELLDRTRPTDRPSGRPRLLRPDGAAAGPPDPEVYSDLFVAEAQAAYANATDDRELWDLAVATVVDCESRFADPDYRPNLSYVLTPDGVPLDSAKHPGARPLGVWMLLIRVLTELIAARADADLTDRLRHAVDVVVTRYLNPRFRLLNEVLDHDLRPSSGPAGSFVYLGHAIETCWMIMDAALLLNEPETFDAVAALFRRHCEVARDPVYGGLFRALIDVDKGVYTLDKTLWVQQEAIVGALLLVEHRTDPWGAELFTDLDGYLHTRFPLRELGSPLWRESTDRTATTLPERARVENYHHPRMLMRTLAALNRMS